MVKSFRAFWICSSVFESKDEVASSRRIILLSLRNALAIDNLCFSPPESLTPFSPIYVSKPSLKLLIKVSHIESFAAL